MNLGHSLDPGLPTTGAMRLTPTGVPLRDLALAQLDIAHALLAGAPDTLHQGIHQARKSVRRVRAALALASGRLGHATERVDAELRRWCRGLSPLRDAQALVEALGRLQDDDFAAPGDGRLAIALAVQRRDSTLHSALARDPAFASRRARLVRVRRQIESLPWHLADPSTALANLAKASRRVDKARERAGRHPDRDLDWHRLRRRIRRVRQMQTLAATAYGIAADSDASSDAIAEALGLAQDDGLILRTCRSRAAFPLSIRRALHAGAVERIVRARR